MKLAIVIEGEQNSGKTSTIKYLLNYQQARLWMKNHIILSNNFNSINVFAEAISSSPTERKEYLPVTLGNSTPDFLIIAEQKGGAFLSSTYAYLNTNSYYIITFKLTNIVGANIWDRWTSPLDEVSRLQARKDEIIKAIINFIKVNNII
ncbi:hypothetical protein [uncultured Bacteroides sp.]|uniref:hypothetical protein n=1 Tax=uncultured Bacteroides sp. TaxID=162156 RepID=UPI0027DB5A0C|nr:hypothetical protein [uncultured Bacteroides sp.]